MKYTIALLAILATQAISAPDIHVSPTGNDTNDGSAGSPFATLEAARDAIRAKENIPDSHIFAPRHP